MGYKITAKAVRRISIWTVLFVVPVVIIFITIYSAAISSIERQAYERLVSEQEKGTRLISDLLEATFAQFLSDLQLVYYAKEFTDYVQIPDDWHRDQAEQLFLRISERRPYIMQIRFLDQYGREEIRVNRMNTVSSPVGREDLQDKSDRDYFRIASGLGPESVYVSELDLNTENGEIVTPFQPVLRFVKPVHRDGSFIGLMVLNFDAHHLLTLFTGYLSSLLKDLSFGLIDRDGDWIIKNDEYVFGFQFDKNEENNLFLRQPELQDAFGTDEQGGKEISGEVYSFHSIQLPSSPDVIWYPDGHRIWTVVSFFNKNQLAALDRNFLLNNPQIMWIFALMLFVIGVSYFVFVYLRENDKQLMKVSSLISEYTHDGVIITDKNRKITFCNKAFENLSGYHREEIVGKEPGIFSAETSPIQMKKAAGVSFSWNGEIWDRAREGYYFLINLLITEIQDYRKIPEYYVGLYTQAKWKACDPTTQTMDESRPILERKHAAPLHLVKKRLRTGIRSIAFLFRSPTTPKLKQYSVPTGPMHSLPISSL